MRRLAAAEIPPMALAKVPDQRYAAMDQEIAGRSELARDERLDIDVKLVARGLRDRFPEAAANGAAYPEEFSTMADNKGGSDLDVFEGLAKKASRAASPALVPPSPPARKPTLVGGVGAPPPPPNHAATLPSGVPSPLPPPVASKGTSPGSLPPPVLAKGTSPGSLPPPVPAKGTSPGSLPPPVPAKGTSPGSLPPPVAPPVTAKGTGPASLPPPVAPPVTAKGAGPASLPPPVAPPVSAKGAGPASLPPPMPPSVKAGSLPPVVPPPSRQPSLPAISVPGVPSKSPLPPPPTSVAPGSLPPVVPPPVRVPSVKPLPKGAADDAKPRAAKGAAVDMNWDDDEESTHVYDRQGNDHNHGHSSPVPAAGSPAIPKAAAALVATSGGAASASRVRTPVPAPPPIPSAPPAPAMPDIGHRPLSRNDEPTAIRQRPVTQQGAGKAGVLLGGLALVAVLILAVVMLVPKKGALAIDLKTPGGGSVARAEIFLDGQKRCDTVPCVVRDLDPGSKVVKILAPDFPPRDAVEVVEGGKEKVVVITLDAASGERASDSASTSTGVKASGAPGVKVFIDGVEKGALPVEVSVPPGEHKLRFDGGERYEPLEQTVDVGQGQMKDLGTVALKVLKGQVTLELATPGASVKLVSAKGTEKKLPDSAWKKPPVKVDVAASERWKIVATKKGHDDFSQAISFEDGQAEKTIRISLEEARKPEPAAAAPAPAPTPEPAAPKAEPAAAAPKAEAPAAPEPAAAAGGATLNINSIPVSKVVLDGHPLGSTPKVGVSVSAGSHTVIFIHPDLGKKSVTVSVKAGETKTAAVKFE
ncbi:PEGA domain-containing protein [Sorangium sp. So ce1000]|uniref:PEGA domain-containing protein n=1 Tax=Sorangium sp. So ce1000 TaxID=3133325 RepID=UPI003F5DE4E1